MSVSATYTSYLTVTEGIGNVPLVNPNEASIVHDQLNKSASFTASTTVVVSKVVAETFALTAGTATIDLTTLTGSNGATVDATGLKIKLIKIKNPTGNSTMTLAAGATNPYTLFGTGWSVSLEAEQELMAYLADAAPAVSGTVKTIDLTGTGTQFVDIIMVFG